MAQIAEKIVRSILRRPVPRVAEESPELREASHRQLNEVTQLNAQVRRITKSRDPFEELARTLRGSHDEFDRNKTRRS